jgi:ribonuclease PH
MSGAGTAEKQYEHLIRRAAEGVLQLALFPRTQISIILQVCWRTNLNGLSLECVRFNMLSPSR